MKEFLLKGFEVELFTGRLTGETVGVSDLVSNVFNDFEKEPDKRNLEYVTLPYKEYSKLREALLVPRRKLRKWLRLKDLTILPGSTLSKGDSKKFERSDKSNPYHDFIELNYGTKVVTASVHINLGIKDIGFLFSALRLIRCEASLFLALSASSPFLDGNLTNFHSYRWLQFPRTPKKVPLFLNHANYVEWVEDHLDNGIMHNNRHLWSSVRPNGPNRPCELNRLEMRICDLITDCDLLLALTALFELRVLSLLLNPSKLDPLEASKLSLNELEALSDENEQKVAKHSLDANLYNWINGKEISCRDWIVQLIEEVKPLALEMNILEKLSPLNTVLSDGNQAMRWMEAYLKGQSVQSLLKETINEMEIEESLPDHNSLTLG